MLPVLRQLGSGEEQAPASVREAVALVFKLSNEELATLLPSGRQTTFANRVAWALGYLTQAGLVESPRRGMYRVTTRGKVTLGEPIERIDI
ncbi:MAG: winged helix-turn-helix domain-containing protein, partial [Nitrospirota bacterium]|nr:winged helix-turn-helix domain-containing protein [Nitrospirota bacterium]